MPEFVSWWKLETVEYITDCEKGQWDTDRGGLIYTNTFNISSASQQVWA